MLVYKDEEKRDVLVRTYTGKRRNHYKATIGGWYWGGFRSQNDTEALKVFKHILTVEREIQKEGQK